MFAAISSAMSPVVFMDMLVMSTVVSVAMSAETFVVMSAVILDRAILDIMVFMAMSVEVSGAMSKALSTVVYVAMSVEVFVVGLLQQVLQDLQS